MPCSVLKYHSSIFLIVLPALTCLLQLEDIILKYTLLMSISSLKFLYDSQLLLNTNPLSMSHKPSAVWLMFTPTISSTVIYLTPLIALISGSSNCLSAYLCLSVNRVLPEVRNLVSLAHCCSPCAHRMQCVLH